MQTSVIQWFILAALATAIQTKIIMEKEPRNTSVNEGDTTVLECVGRSSTTDNAIYECSWLKDNQVMFVGTRRRKQFYDWVGDYQSGNCSIILKNVSVTWHQGLWRCDITNMEASGNEMASTVPIMVTILVSPTVPEIQDNVGTVLVQVTIMEGQRQELQCISRHGSPAAYLQWTLNNKDISMNATFYNKTEISRTGGGESFGGSTNEGSGGAFMLHTAGSWLTLHLNRSHDNSILKCLSSHPTFSNGDVKSSSVLLNIIYPPKNVSIDNNLTVPMDSYVELDCPLDGKPSPSYTWYWQRQNEPNGNPISWQKQLILNNLSGELMEGGGYFCSASTLMGSQNFTAYSGMYMLTTTQNATTVASPNDCDEDTTTLYILLGFATFALVSLGIELILLICFRCQHKKVPGQSFLMNVLYELYATRGRKMALVHVRGEHDDKGGKGYTLHIPATLVTVIMIILDIITIIFFVISMAFCFHIDNCSCNFFNPAIICTICFGIIIVILQFIFLATFCIRKKEDSKYRDYARKQEDVPGSTNDENTTRNKGDAIIMPTIMEQNENSIKQSNKNGQIEDEVPGSVPV